MLLKPTLSHFLAPLCVFLLVGLGIAAQTALEPRIGVLEQNQTAQAQTLSPLVTLASLHTQEACAKQAGGCNPIFSIATTIALNTPMLTPLPATPTPEAWCNASVASAKGLNARTTPNGQVITTLPNGLKVQYDAGTVRYVGNLSWVQLRSPQANAGLWVALNYLTGVQC
jgi:hypothetical protein